MEKAASRYLGGGVFVAARRSVGERRIFWQRGGGAFGDGCGAGDIFSKRFFLGEEVLVGKKKS